MNSTIAALEWITKIITKHNIPYQIAGGLAVRAYGSTRPLHDIDIDIPEDDFSKILVDVSEYVKVSPMWYKDETWDIYLMSLSYNGQEIDICGAYQLKMRNKLNSKWESIHTDFEKVSYIDFEGLNLPVISRDELIAYKKLLGRPVDILDVDWLEKQSI
jgi:hypothetical protein